MLISFNSYYVEGENAKWYISSENSLAMSVELNIHLPHESAILLGTQDNEKYVFTQRLTLK